jgi:carbon storage regulator CsrA
MLVLTRKANEEILIGDDIKITLVRIKGGSVRVGIEAPSDIKVTRGELNRFAKAEVEIDPVAEVFAHPESQNLAGHLAAGTNRVAKADALTAATKTELFVGTVSRSGNETKLRRAPLSGFVAAS